METKICVKCSAEKSISDFYKYPDPEKGYKRHCRACAVGYSKRWVIKNREKVKEYNRKWRSNNKDKTVAHDKVYWAKKDGRLIEEPCEVCGGEDHIIAHHDDYSKALDVRWLCHQHHVDIHSGKYIPIPEEER